MTFIDTLNVPEEVRQELRALTPERYLGIAGRLARLSD